jgi:predicted TIM-barrel fold metal-dependent hydrolase
MIDVSAHLGHFAFRRLRHNTAGEILALMDLKRIDKAVVASAAAIAYRNSQAGNEEMVAQLGAHRDRLIPFAVLNPAYAGWDDDLKICHEEFGAKGLRLYPRWHNYRLTDASCLELVHAAAERGLVVSIPVRVEDRRQGSWLVDIPDVDHEEIAALVRSVPQAKFIVANGSGFVGSTLGRKNNGLPPNYVVDIALLSAELANEIGQLVANLGEDRLVFGTGMPFHYPDPALVKLELLEATEAVKEKIRHGNAARLLGV